MTTNEPIMLFYSTPKGIKNEQINGLLMNGFRVTSEHRFIDQASAIIFHMPSLCRDDKMFTTHRKREGQIWIFWSGDSVHRYPWHDEPAIRDLFNLTATYQLDSDIPMPFIYSDHFAKLRREPVTKKGFLAAFISDAYDHSNRVEYLQELMSYIKVDSYGEILNNRPLDHDGGRVVKTGIIPDYKFTIAFEGARAKDYVTSELFDPLIAGSVPIYLGAPNVEDFVPGDHCYINVDSFPSIRELADHILELDNDEERYNEYLGWKTRPYRLSFNLKAGTIAGGPMNRLCRAIKTKMAEF